MKIGRACSEKQKVQMLLAIVFADRACMSKWTMDKLADDPALRDFPATEAGKGPISPAAQRALAEAAERRRAREVPAAIPEHDGPKGVEPTRFGDWERKGIAYDF
jgi:hypothetical protein